MKKINKNLTEEQNKILFKKETEKAFSGKLLHNKSLGKYLCANCKEELFDSNSKFDSDTGWPSFDKAKNIKLKEDNSFGMKRNEVTCGNCEAHLGHVFEDGSTKTKKRYCINSLALDFKEKIK